VKTIFLLRHAKSSWDDPNLEDFHRPLNKRGRKAAKAMGEAMEQWGWTAPLVLCSPATRTRQTLDMLGKRLTDAEIIYDQRIYEAGLNTLMARLKELPESCPAVLLVGHNPGLERLAIHLSDGEGEALPRLKEKYPTGTLAVLRTELTDWAALTDGSCRLEAFLKPSDLDQEE